MGQMREEREAGREGRWPSPSQRPKAGTTAISYQSPSLPSLTPSLSLLSPDRLHGKAIYGLIQFLVGAAPLAEEQITDQSKPDFPLAGGQASWSRS